MSGNDLSNNRLTEQHKKIIKYVCANTHFNETEALNALHYYKGDVKKVIQVATAQHMVGLVMRQTTYTHEEAIEKLKLFNGEPVDVIKDFMGIKKKEKKVPKTRNQMIFSEIRSFMDDVNKGYNERKEASEKIKKLQQSYLKHMKSQNMKNE
jgi:NACalpha-BTF3-like transcription factor